MSSPSSNAIFQTDRSPNVNSCDDSFIHVVGRAFAPRVIVLASEAAEVFAREYGATDFRNLLQPLGDKVSGRIVARDVQAASIRIDDFAIRFVEKFNNDGQQQQYCSMDDLQATLEEKMDESDFKASYNYMLRKALASNFPVCAHETFAHPVAIMFVVMAGDSQSQMRSLYNIAKQMITPPFVDNDFLKYHVVIQKGDSLEEFNLLKKEFGLHSHLVKLEGGEDLELLPSEWSSVVQDRLDYGLSIWMPEKDLSAFSEMVREMVLQSIVPHLERCIARWNDQFASYRKGLAGRFLNVSRRFGFNSRSSSPSNGNLDPTTMTYPVSSPEVQMRRMADFAVMIRDWKFASSIYEIIRRDFLNDKAMRYLAAAQEMSCLSILLSQTLTPKIKNDVDSLLDGAVHTYLSRCSLPEAAFRCILENVEALASRGSDDSALWAMYLVNKNMVSGVLRPLIIQRIAHCFVRKRRKSALWMVLACEAWLECGRVDFARNCLNKVKELLSKTMPFNNENNHNNNHNNINSSSSSAWRRISAHVDRLEELVAEHDTEASKLKVEI